MNLEGIKSSIAETLYQIGIFLKEEKQQFQLYVKQASTTKKIAECLWDKTGLNPSKSFIKNQEIMGYLNSDFLPIFLTYLISNHIQSSSPSTINKIQEVLRKPLKKKQILYEVYNFISGQQVSENQLQDFEKELSEYDDQFKELELINTRENEGKNSDLSVKDLDNQEKIKILSDQILEETPNRKIEDCKEYIQELQDDIKEMPENVVDYKLRKAEIDCGEEFLSTGQEPSKLSDLHKNMVESLPSKNREVVKAKEQILKGNDIRRNLKVLRFQLCGIDIHDILRMINKGKEENQATAQKAHEDGKKMKVILFFGLSKAGKSTLIARCLGYQMKQKIVNGMSTVQPVGLSNEHKDLIIGNSSRSTTRYPRLYEVPIKKFFPQDDQDNKTYCMDVAGLQDTAGLQVECANRVTLGKFMQTIQKLQIIIVISQKNWGDTGKEIYKLAKATSSIFKDLKKVKNSIRFVFNNCTNKFLRQLQRKIADLEENNEIQNIKSVHDENYKFFFKLLKQQSTKIQRVVIDIFNLEPRNFFTTISKQIFRPGKQFIAEDIGSECKRAIEEQYKRCQEQFKKWYKQGGIREASFYIYLIAKISEIPGFQDKDKDLKTYIESTFGGKIQSDIQVLRNGLQRLKGMAQRSKEKRKIKTNQFYQDYEKLRQEAKKYVELNKNQGIVAEVQSLITNHIQWIKRQINEWDSVINEGEQKQLEDSTRNGICFLQVFHQEAEAISYSIQKYKAGLQEKEKQLTEKLKKYIEEEHQDFFDYLLFLDSLQMAQEKQKDYSGLRIQDRFRELKGNISSLNLNRDLDPTKIIIPENRKDEIKNIERLLLFVKKFKDRKQFSEWKQYQETYKHIMVVIPSKLKEVLDELLNQSSGEKIQVLKDITSIIQLMNFLLEIGPIGKKYEEKLINNNQLKIIIDQELFNIRKIIEDLNNNKIQNDGVSSRIKNILEKLSKMITIVNRQQISQKFKQMEKNLAKSIKDFIQSNSLESVLSLSSDTSLEYELSNYQRLYGIKGVLSGIKGVIQGDENSQNTLATALKNLQQGLISPIDSMLNKIIQSKTFSLKNLEFYHLYVKKLQKKVRKVAQGQFHQKILNKQKQIQENVRKGYEDTVKQPIEKLKNTLSNIVHLNQQSITDLVQYLQDDVVNNHQKAYKKMIEIQRYQTIQQLFEDNEDNLYQLSTVCDDFQLKMKQIIRIADSKDILIRLGEISRKLNHILKGQKFKEAQNRAERRYTEIVKNQDNALQIFIDTNNSPLNFDGEKYRRKYDQTVSDQDKDRLKKCLNNYEQKVLQELRREFEEIDEIYSLLEQIERQLVFFQKYKTYLKNRKEVGQRGLVSSNYIGRLVGNMFEKLKSYFRKLEESYNYLKKDEIAKIQKKVRALEIQIRQMDSPLIKQQQQHIAMEQLLQSMKDKKQQILKNWQNKSMVDQLNDGFLKIMGSLNEQQRRKFEEKASDDFNKEISQLSTNKRENYKEFSKNKKKLHQKIKYLKDPTQEQHLEQVIKDIEKQSRKEMNELEFHELQRDFQDFLTRSKKFESSGDLASNEEVIAIIKEKYQKKKITEKLSFFKEYIWSNREVICDQQLKELGEQFVRLEKELFNEIERLINKHIRFIQKQKEDEIQFSDSLSIKSQLLNSRANSLQKLLESQETLSYAGRTQLLEQKHKQKVVALRNKTDAFFDNYLKAGEDIGKKFKDYIIKEFQAIKTSNMINQLFQDFQKYQKDYLILSKTKDLKFQEKFTAQLINLEQCKGKLFQEVAEKTKFIFYDDRVRENSLEQDRQRVENFKKSQIMLQKIMIPYNTYLEPPIPINQAENKEYIDRNLQNISKEYQSSLNDHIVMNKKVNYNLRILQLFESRYYEQCLAITRERVDAKGHDLQKSINSLNQQCEQIESNKVKYLKQLKDEQEKQKFQNNEKKIKQNKKYEEKLVDKSQEQKQALQQQRIAALSLISNEMQKKKKEIYEEKEKRKNDDKQQKRRRAQDVVDGLIDVKKFESIRQIKEKVENKINENLKKLKRNTPGYSFLYDFLKASDDLFATRILGEYEIFSKKYQSQLFQEETSETNSLEYMIGQMKNLTPSQYTKLREYYNIFDREQNFNIGDYSNNIYQLASSTINEASQLQNQHKAEKFIKPERKVQLLAKIFALWSISTSEEAEEGQPQYNSTKKKAHAAQILCVLIILCFDDDKNLQNRLFTENRLAQVKTGQGKSIVLATISVYLALFGYQVHCACYSKILSRRDLESFQQLFKLCQVQNKIYYGTFEEIIKVLLNQESQYSQGEKFQSLVEQVLASKNPQSSFISKFFGKIKEFFTFSNKQKTKKVLLIDEIDVLFNKDYFGETFNRSVALRDPTITRLIKFIWDNRKNQIDHKKITQSIQFKDVVQKFEPLKQILENQVYGMIAALETYNDPKMKYSIDDKKIKYKFQDSLTEKINYRYNTVYAYLSEYEKAPAKISEKAFEENMVITLCVAQFAYHMLPRYYFGLLGVTGTLNELPTFIRQNLSQQYKINKGQMFPIPSIYKKNIRTIADPKYALRNQHYEQLVKNINQVKERPILVFFDSRNKLNKFFNSEEFTYLRSRTTILHEEDSYEDREMKIKGCQEHDRITLMTKSFIRGTDFKLNNKKVIAAGGYHAIVAYLIDIPADYIQATGRIARQGKEGSFIEIYTEQELESLGINHQGLSTASLNQLVKEYRREKQEQLKEKIQDNLKKSQKKHKETIQIFGKEFSKEKLIHYIKTNSSNRFPQLSSRSNNARLLILVDATYSMNSLFDRLKIILEIIFEDCYEILAKKRFPGCLQLQLVLYRNYNCDVDEILEVSAFDNRGQILKDFLRNTYVAGGWGNEAVEIALQYANQQQDIKGIFIIGDARGNTEKDINQKRNQYPKLEKKRIEEGMTWTTTESQLEKLISKKIKINNFYLKNTKSTKQYFQMLSKKTGGSSQYININKSDASHIITTSIVEEALMIIGGQGNGETLRDAYRQLLEIRMGK